MSGPWITDQDQEDYEQEREIERWLKQQGKESEFDFKHISSKGTARNTLVRASFSLDQQISEDSTGTFADLIAGSDGRDLYRGEDPEPEDIIDAYLFYLGFNEEETEWLTEKLKWWASKNQARSQIYQIDLELLEP